MLEMRELSFTYTVCQLIMSENRCFNTAERIQIMTTNKCKSVLNNNNLRSTYNYKYLFRSVWLPQDTPGYPRTLQDSIICMFNILYERVDDGLVLVCWRIN